VQKGDMPSDAKQLFGRWKKNSEITTRQPRLGSHFANSALVSLNVGS
jgi:hypothetical protein